MHPRERLAAALQKKWGRIVLILLIPWSLAALASTMDCYCYRGRIYPGVYVQGVAVGGLDLVRAEEKLAAELFNLERITFTGLEQGPETISLTQLGVSYDRENTMKTLRRLGTGGRGYPGRLRRLLKSAPLRLAGTLRVKTELLQKALEALARKVNTAPREASFTVDGAIVSIEKEREGRFLQLAELENRLLAAIQQGKPKVPLPIGKLKVQPSAAVLAGYGVDRVMISFATTVSAAMPERVQNIRLGAEAINGCLLAPGEMFSFEATVGEVSAEKGYQEAPVIVGGELRPGLGGGLCQVSSTLYNAALLANLSILERHNHSLAINYLPLGRDATISIGSADLKFKNNRNHHILIGADLKGGLLTFRLFGPPMEERVVLDSSDITRVEPPIRYEEDRTLPAGEKELASQGEPGYSVKTWRIVFRGGEEITRELLSHDHYHPTPTVYRIGTGRTFSGPALPWKGYVLAFSGAKYDCNQNNRGGRRWIYAKK